MRARKATRPARKAPVAWRLCPICNDSIEERICKKDGTATLSLDAPPSDPDRLQSGMVIADRYRIEQLIGSGGFSKVFRASHTGTGQSVALKVLNSVSFDDGSAMLRRFFREARASAGLRHPNTVRVFDFGQEEDGTVFLAMELLAGRTLRAEVQHRLQKHGALEEEEVVRIALAVAGSLGEAHALGMVHRDVGPNNVFLHRVAASEPVVKVLDFGLVKDGGKQITRAHQLFGTLGFMSPEQAAGRAVGPPSDLYSLGLTMWFMMAGKAPFGGDTPNEVMRCHLFQPLPSLAEHAKSAVSPELEQIIARAAAKDVEARFPDAPAMKRALEACLDRAMERRHARTHLVPKRPAKGRAALLSFASATALLALGWGWIGDRAELDAAPLPKPIPKTPQAPNTPSPIAPMAPAPIAPAPIEPAPLAIAIPPAPVSAPVEPPPVKHEAKRRPHVRKRAEHAEPKPLQPVPAAPSILKHRI